MIRTEYIIKAVLLQSVPETQRERVSAKIKSVLLSDLPHVLSRAITQSNMADTSPVQTPVCVTGQGWQGGRGRGTGFSRGRGGFQRGGSGAQGPRFSYNNNTTSQQRFPFHNTTQSQPRPQAQPELERNTRMASNGNWIPNKDQCWKCLQHTNHFSINCNNKKRCPYHSYDCIGHTFLECYSRSDLSQRTMQAITDRRAAATRTQPKQVFFTQTSQPHQPQHHHNPYDNQHPCITSIEQMKDMED